MTNRKQKAKSAPGDRALEAVVHSAVLELQLAQATLDDTDGAERDGETRRALIRLFRASRDLKEQIGWRLRGERCKCR